MRLCYYLSILFPVVNVCFAAYTHVRRPELSSQGDIVHKNYLWEGISEKLSQAVGPKVRGGANFGDEAYLSGI